MVWRCLINAVVMAGVLSGQGADVRLVGDARVMGAGLRLTRAVPQMAGAAWFTRKQLVTAGFEVTFAFRISERGGLGPGADGFAFVIQNEGPDALAGRGSAGGWAIGDGHHDWASPGIPRSIAVFFDTFQNGNEDPSDNYVAICTNQPSDSAKWPPRRLAVSRRMHVRLKDGKEHFVRILFRPPLMSVALDDGEPEFRAPVDLAPVADGEGNAYVGFTASTGSGYENHDILRFSFQPSAGAASSTITSVESELTFLPDNCLPDRNLCTPRRAIVEQTAPGVFSVILPANAAWPAMIPNPGNRRVEIVEARGLACFELGGPDLFVCGGPSGLKDGEFGAKARATLLAADEAPGAILAQTKGGETRLSVNLPKGRTKGNQGFYDLVVRIR